MVLWTAYCCLKEVSILYDFCSVFEIQFPEMGGLTSIDVQKDQPRGCSTNSLSRQSNVTCKPSKVIPTPSGSGSFGIHCDAWVTLENWSQTHSQASQCTQWNQFDAAVDTWFGCSLSLIGRSTRSRIDARPDLMSHQSEILHSLIFLLYLSGDGRQYERMRSLLPRI